MTKRKLSFAPWILLGAICALAGCSRNSRPDTYPVTGVVTYKGKPAAGASVAFLAPGASRHAVGTTDEAGKFQLTTFEPNDGAIGGTHVVTVSKTESPPGPSYVASPDGRVDPAAIERAMLEAARHRERADRAGSELPEKYANHATSDLRLEVVEGPNHFEIELKD
jgi:hypothetical protein